MTDKSLVHVAVGVVLNSNDQVLVSRRHEDSHQGGLWEFPGGKVEQGETVPDALRRELSEELGLNVEFAVGLCKIRYDYPDKSVLLDVWRVCQFSGQARGLEGQPLVWRDPADLAEADFPAANIPIIRRLKLPFWMAITPQMQSLQELDAQLDQYFQNKVSVIQLRQKTLAANDYLQWFEHAARRCQEKGVRLLFNHDQADYPIDCGGGRHLSARQLLRTSTRPVPPTQLFSAACHNLEELQQAQGLDADFAILSPVLPTDKYAGHELLGWEGFRQLRSQVQMPVYALGGLSLNDRARARAVGADGIAGIRLFLDR